MYSVLEFVNSYSGLVPFVFIVLIMVLSYVLRKVNIKSVKFLRIRH